MRIPFAPWLTICLVLSGCSTMSKRAAEFYEAGAYADALAMYDKILAEDPNDSDAIIGRMKAREKLIDSKLIEVRRSRMGGNEQNSLDMLLELVSNELKWGTFPKGAVAYTQDEESKEAFRFFTSKVRQSLKRNFPLKAKYELDTYKPIFQGPLAGAFDGLYADAVKQGTGKCRELTSSAGTTRPYYSLFVQRFCALWGQDARSLAAVVEKKHTELFHSIQFSARIEGLPDVTLATFDEQLSVALQSTPWYDAKGTNVIKLSLRGNYARETSQQPEVRHHSYTVSIPYTAYEPQTKTRQIPYTTTETKCDYSGTTPCKSVPVTRYRSESYSENVAVTRYRSEPRTQRYDGLLLYQMLGLFIHGTGSYGRAPVSLRLAEKSEVTGFQHSWNLPDIGLAPASANLPDPLEWIKQQAATLAETFRTASYTSWENLHCRPTDQQATMASHGEQVHRCLRAKLAEAPPFVTAWYQNHFGVTLAEAAATIGLTEY